MRSQACLDSLSRGAWGFPSYREYLAQLFPGRRIRKLCLQAGFTCPNIDGRRGRGGCHYCNNHGFAPGLASRDNLLEQWRRGCVALRHRHRRVDGFIAYFQSFSNTDADPHTLRRLYEPLPGCFPDCVGASISTRPDCVSEPVLDLLGELSRRMYLCLELGLQSDSEQLLLALGRGHSVAEFLDAVERAARRDLELCAHVILGLPGEDAAAPERLGRLFAELPLRSVKIHNYHLMRGTRLARAADPARGPDRASYLDMVLRLVEQLRSDQCVQRLIADAPDRLLLSDPWCHDKQGFLAEVGQGLNALRRGIA